jgi:hypothetical protein
MPDAPSPASARPPAGLALFLRHPEPGTVKTKLAAALGADRAARFYWECALLVMAKVLRLRACDVYVFVTPAERLPDVEPLVMARFGRFEGRFLAQRGDALGERVHHALERLRTLGYERQMVVGTDSPTLPPEYLQRAVDDLGRLDMVVGPTWSGGTWMVGTRRPDVRALRDVDWRSGGALAKLHENAAALGWSLGLLPRWQDVDGPDDLPFLEGQVRHADYRRLRGILEEAPPEA